MNSIREIFSPLFFWKNRAGDMSDMTTAPLEATQELERRRRDPALQRAVEEYLQGDIPEYFNNGPILYLARHIATPNFETLRFKYLMEPLGMKAVVGQDTKDLFVSNNQAKRALGKLSICRGISQSGTRLNERFENISIIDFNTANGKRFDAITTLWGERLVDFHAHLFSKFTQKNTESPDDAEWIDRHHRGDLLQHYKELMSLFVVHGIFFEDYLMKDAYEASFVRHILRPACRFIEQRFGFRPIIVPLVPKTFESDRFWVSYPEEVLDIVRERMHT
ncbi:MAG: hypothetical protein WC814_00715 [Candidatus Paceibacterota bacterium]|jgi:hypothetical protein